MVQVYLVQLTTTDNKMVCYKSIVYTFLSLSLDKQDIIVRNWMLSYEEK